MNYISSFFTKKDMYLMEHLNNGKSRKITLIPMKRRKKMMYDNMHLMEGMTFTTTSLHCPQLEPYTGNTDFISVSYEERNKHDGKNEALHFFLDDYRFRSADDCFLESFFSAYVSFSEEKSQKINYWKEAYRKEAEKNQILMEYIQNQGIPMPTIISGNIVLEHSIKKPKKMHVADLLQTKDKKQVLERLHARIDGIGGKNVAMILVKAKEDAIICRFPTEAEFKSEFPDATGCWRSISYYLNPNHPVDCSSVII